MFNSPYPNFVNVRSEDTCKCFVLISRIEFALSALYSTDIIIIIIINVVFCHRPFLPGTSLDPAVIPTSHASSFTLQYFPYCVMFQVQLPFVVNLSSVFLVQLPNFSLSFSLLFQWLQLLLV
jgi:hypothetical protein